VSAKLQKEISEGRSEILRRATTLEQEESRRAQLANYREVWHPYLSIKIRSFAAGRADHSPGVGMSKQHGV